MNVTPEELLEEYRKVTPGMTEEKYEYLKESTSLSPVKAVQLALLKRKTDNPELIARAEYSLLFESYANKWEKTWEQYGEGTNLYDFADGALTDSMADWHPKSR